LRPRKAKLTLDCQVILIDDIERVVTGLILSQNNPCCIATRSAAARGAWPSQRDQQRDKPPTSALKPLERAEHHEANGVKAQSVRPPREHTAAASRPIARICLVPAPGPLSARHR